MKTRPAITLLFISLLISCLPSLVFASTEERYSSFDISVIQGELDPKASDIISKYTYFTKAIGDNKINVYADLHTLNKGTLTADITLQVYENGIWRREASWQKEVNDASILSFSNDYKGTNGKKYRAVIYYTATVGNKFDSCTFTTSTSTAY